MMRRPHPAPWSFPMLFQKFLFAPAGPMVAALSLACLSQGCGKPPAPSPAKSGAIHPASAPDAGSHAGAVRPDASSGMVDGVFTGSPMFLPDPAAPAAATAPAAEAERQALIQSMADLEARSQRQEQHASAARLAAEQAIAELDRQITAIRGDPKTDRQTKDRLADPLLARMAKIRLSAPPPKPEDAQANQAFDALLQAFYAANKRNDTAKAQDCIRQLRELAPRVAPSLRGLFIAELQNDHPARQP